MSEQVQVTVRTKLDWPERRSARVAANRAVQYDPSAVLTIAAFWLRNLVDVTYEADKALDSIQADLERYREALERIADNAQGNGWWTLQRWARQALEPHPSNEETG